VVLDASLLDAVDVRDGLKPDGVLLVNSACRLPEEYYSDKYRTLTVDATSDALEILGQPVTNTAMFGALVAASELVPLEAALLAVDEVMAPELREQNKKVLQATFLQLKKGMAQ
jgi:2-oxoacid:acceptor oxidoreductase gamma subunit (pyruvate/2-ketoisovalerate family)